jgi:hypothetical protein
MTNRQLNALNSQESAYFTIAAARIPKHVILVYQVQIALGT